MFVIRIYGESGLFVGSRPDGQPEPHTRHARKWSTAGDVACYLNALPAWVRYALQPRAVKIDPDTHEIVKPVVIDAPIKPLQNSGG